MNDDGRRIEIVGARGNPRSVANVLLIGETGKRSRTGLDEKIEPRLLQRSHVAGHESHAALVGNRLFGNTNRQGGSFCRHCSGVTVPRIAKPIYSGNEPQPTVARSVADRARGQRRGLNDRGDSQTVIRVRDFAGWLGSSLRAPSIFWLFDWGRRSADPSHPFRCGVPESRTVI